ncbi:hypothetical protein [Accumulibacter sp.]|uniref:hypothetical protein n=1 Tax=Accumulibacter sp. TaxID=2053492 RepID=UPI0025C6765B|nr:hypothetical protein [Accumulibacter sp.]
MLKAPENGGVVSSPKCKELMKESGEVEIGQEEFGGAMPAEAFAWSRIRLPSNGIGFDPRETGQIGALWERLA